MDDESVFVPRESQRVSWLPVWVVAGLVAVALAIVAAISSGYFDTGPRVGDSLVLTGSESLWKAKADLLKHGDVTVPEKERSDLFWSGSHSQLHEGSVIRILDLEGDAFRVQVVEDNDRVDLINGNKKGLIGYVKPGVPAVKVAK